VHNGSVMVAGGFGIGPEAGNGGGQHRGGVRTRRPPLSAMGGWRRCRVGVGVGSRAGIVAGGGAPGFDLRRERRWAAS
jgi:hypothetical protein